MATWTAWLPPAYSQYICRHREIPLLCLSLSASCPFRSHSSHFCHPPVCMHHHLMSGFTTSSPWRRHCAISAGVADAEHRICAVLLAQFARSADSASRPEAAQHILGSGSGFFGHTYTQTDRQTDTDTHSDDTQTQQTQTHTDTHRHTQTHTQTHTDTHGHTRTHTDTHTHMRICACVWRLSSEILALRGWALPPARMLELSATWLLRTCGSRSMAPLLTCSALAASCMRSRSSSNHTLN